MATIDNRVIVVLDDCLTYNNLWTKDKQIVRLLTSGRDYNITVIITLQYTLGCSHEMCNNFDHIFLLSEDFNNNRKKLYNHYASMFPSYDIFVKVFKHVTADYGAMVICNRVNCVDIRRKVFWFKVDLQQQLTRS